MPPALDELERLYNGGGDPGRWLTIPGLAKHYGVSEAKIRVWMAAAGLRPRTPKEGWKKIQWCMRQGSNPQHFSNLERLAAEALECHGLTGWQHNFKMGTASLDFWFPEHQANLEIDSVWHTAEFQNMGRGPDVDARRDERLWVNHGVKTFRVMFDPKAIAAMRSVARFAWALRSTQEARITTLVADPPWPFGDSLPGPKRGAKKHYSLMSLRDIMDYPLPPINDDARLFLWRVSSMQDEALKVCQAWGFKPKSELVWIKTTKTGKRHMGMGRQVRNGHESCIIAVRGRPERLDNAVMSWFIAPMLGHSVKPDKFYHIVERLSPGPYCELFARMHRPGWTCLGDQLNPSMIESWI